MTTLNPPDQIPDLGLRFLPPPDLDYGDAFQNLAAIELTMRREGNTEELLLRRAHAMLALGNYLRAAFDAEEVARGNPESSEAQYVKGQASLAMAAIRMGLARPGIGSYLPRSSLPKTVDLLAMAKQCFASVVARHPEDPQAARALAAVDRLAQVNGTVAGTA
jgi:tetratricopeptide (TPR) repeat protein